jgi:hypothetical protein
MKPYCCPVCLGVGTMPAGFYDQSGSNACTARETCRSCDGTGILWEITPGEPGSKEEAK